MKRLKIFTILIITLGYATDFVIAEIHGPNYVETEKYIRQQLGEINEIRHESRPNLPENFQRKLIDFQPVSGEVLLDIIEDIDDPLNRQTTNALLKIWDSLASEQIEDYFYMVFDLWTDYRKKYPQGAGSYIGMSYRLNEFGWGGVPDAEDVKIKTLTRHFLDGDKCSEDFSYDGPMAATGSFSVKNLDIGPHIFNWITEYQISYRDKIFKDQVKSEEYYFEIVPVEEIDTLAKEPDEAVQKLVTEAFEIAEIQPNYNQMYGHGVDPWEPQGELTYYGKRIAHHVPVWRVKKKLPIDLCFQVDFKLEDTGEVVYADSICLLKGKTRDWTHFGPGGIPDIAISRTGFVPIRVILKPSRAIAYGNTKVTGYYNRQIVSKVMRIKIIHRESPDYLQIYKEVWDNTKTQIDPEKIKQLVLKLQGNDEDKIGDRMSALKELEDIVGLSFGFRPAIDTNSNIMVAQLRVSLREWRMYSENLLLAINERVPSIINGQHSSSWYISLIGEKSPHRVFLPLLKEIAANPLEDNNMRKAAIKAISRIPHEGLIEYLITQLDTDNQPYALDRLSRLTQSRIRSGEDIKKRYEDWWEKNKDKFEYERGQNN